MSDDALTECPHCGSKAQRLISTPAIKVAAEVTSDDELTRRRYGLNRNQRVHQNFMTGEVLKFDRLDSDATMKERIRKSYADAGIEEPKTRLIK